VSLKTDRWGRQNARTQFSVVLSTYNQPEWLEKVLLGYARQSFRDFELLIADDGSNQTTRAVIERIAPTLEMPLIHLWHPDEGFRKCVILNRAIEAARSDYLVFSDGDCVPRQDFLSVHAAQRQPGRFLSGGYCKLPMSTSRSIDIDCIARGDFTDPAWLGAHGCTDAAISRKLRVHGGWARVWDFLSTAKASWNGHNASGWRSDIVAVNGFDERMQYGGQDREFGERLVNYGIRGKRIRHRAVVVHLDHPRGYATADSIERNRAIRAETRRLCSVWAQRGITHGPSPLPFGLPLRNEG
jgi:glycosyltransferase involved in cell wall biosynthesis